jgi:protein-S-isoprenylcysteine O-methyltransferase Ste14
MPTLEHKIPPPLVAAAIAFAMWPLSSLLPTVAASDNARLATATVFALAGIAFAGAGAIAFRRARTTVNPLNPEQTTALVTGSIYRISRNPMYVGMLLCLLAWAVFLASPLSLAGPVAFILFINRFQIEPEEKVLAAKFGDTFARYRASTRRWI